MARPIYVRDIICLIKFVKSSQGSLIFHLLTKLHDQSVREVVSWPSVRVQGLMCFLAKAVKDAMKHTLAC